MYAFLISPIHTTRPAHRILYFLLQLPSSLSEYRAVMVFFHGGGFCCGSGNASQCGPEYLMEGDIVLVTVNYRLGPLGKS